MLMTRHPIAPLAGIYLASLVVGGLSSETVRWDLLSVVALAMRLLASGGVLVVAAMVLLGHRAEAPVLFWLAVVGGFTTAAVEIYSAFQDWYSPDFGAGLVLLIGMLLLAVGAFATTTSRRTTPRGLAH